MNFDLAFWLVVLVVLSGLIGLSDRLAFAPVRRRRAAEIAGIAALSESERNARARDALREPVVVDYARSFFPVLLVILILRSFIAEPFKIPSGSMIPTLRVGDYVLVSKSAYSVRLPVLNTRILDIGSPQRGDVVVFRYPEDPRQDYIKRVIGLPGDSVIYRNKTLYVNGEEIAQTYVGPYIGPSADGARLGNAQVRVEKLGAREHRMLTLPGAGREGEWQVPAASFFVMGDNRDNSEDSRVWGFVPADNLVGRAFMVWMHWHDGIDFGRIGMIIR